MAKSKLTDEDILQIENDIKEVSIPYDYDTKEYPLELIVSKFNPKEGTEQTLVARVSAAGGEAGIVRPVWLATAR